MPYSHKRSPEKIKERRERRVSFEERMKAIDDARAIVKDNCQRDLVTGEIAYEKSKESTIERALKVRFEGLVPTHALAHEDGEVLNRAILPCWWR